MDGEKGNEGREGRERHFGNVESEQRREGAAIEYDLMSQRKWFGRVT